MAFSQLAGSGADCGPSNPMSGLMKQFQQDRSLQQDRFTQDRSAESSRSAFRTRNQGRPMMGSPMTEEFFREEAVAKGPHNRFEFSELNKELENIHPGTTDAPDWAADFMREQPMIMNDHHQMEEFDNVFQQHHRMRDIQAGNHGWEQEFTNFEQSHNQSLAPQEMEAFERAFEEAKQGSGVDWEKEFASQEDSWASEFNKQEEGTVMAGSEKEALAKTAGMLLDSIDVNSNPKFKSSNFLSFMRQLRDSEVSIEGSKVVPNSQQSESSWASEFAGGETSTGWAKEFNQGLEGAKDGNMWSEEFAKGNERGWVEDFTSTAGQSSAAANSSTAAAQDWATEFNNDPVNAAQMEEAFSKGTEFNDWVQQYHQNIAHLKTAQDAEWEGMQKDWDKYKPDQGLGYRADNAEFNDYGFLPNNPYLTRAMPIDGGNNLSDSILALEAKVQLDPSDATSWQQLGFRQQENERDSAAIAALKKAVTMDPSLLDAWLGLAVSYTNENCRADAYDCLDAWLQHNETYKHIASSRGMKNKMVAADRHAFVTNLFLEAARSSPGEEMDPDVQVGLGVLFNVSEEYQKAIDCFKAALASRPQDYLLWNKLGATLANSHETPAAIDAYFNALEINPSYIRARYNLAISCINLGQHKEAAEHLLTALALQQSSESNATEAPLIDENGNQYTVPGGMSDNVWDSLRMVMFMMNRQDLATQCDARNLEAFRGVYDF